MYSTVGVTMGLQCIMTKHLRLLIHIERALVIPPRPLAPGASAEATCPLAKAVQE